MGEYKRLLPRNNLNCSDPLSLMTQARRHFPNLVPCWELTALHDRGYLLPQAIHDIRMTNKESTDDQTGKVSTGLEASSGPNTYNVQDKQHAVVSRPASRTFRSWSRSSFTLVDSSAICFMKPSCFMSCRSAFSKSKSSMYLSTNRCTLAHALRKAGGL